MSRLCVFTQIFFAVAAPAARGPTVNAVTSVFQFAIFRMVGSTCSWNVGYQLSLLTNTQEDCPRAVRSQWIDSGL